jgi:hypothetical protein
MNVPGIHVRMTAPGMNVPGMHVPGMNVPGMHVAFPPLRMKEY